MVAEEQEKHDADLKQSTAYFEEAVSINVNNASVIMQEKKSGNENNKRNIVR